MAFAGFSPGEAEGLRRAMSRKRSAAAIEAYHERFVEGAARTHGADAETAERVYAMIVGFSGFGFPKAHGAAFGLLAYQSTWLRVHYAPEFLCALLNEQPMGFYAPDTLAHEAQRKGIELIAPDVNLSGEECTVDAGRPHPARARLRARRAQRRGGGARRRARGGRPVPLAGRPGLARRRGPRGPRPPRLGGRLRRAAAVGGRCGCRGGGGGAGGGAPPAPARGGPRCGGSAWPRRAPRSRRARSSRCRSTCPARRRSSRWRPGTRWSPTTRPPGSRSARTRSRCCGPSCPRARSPTRDLETLPHETPVTHRRARRRPPAARDGQGHRVPAARGRVRDDQPDRPAAVYERHRLIVRSEPLLLARGRLEKLPIAGGAINVFVRALRPLAAPGAGGGATSSPLPDRGAPAAAGGRPAAPRRRPRALAAASAGRRRAGRLPRRRPGRCRASRPGGGDDVALAPAPARLPRRRAARTGKVRARWPFSRSSLLFVLLGLGALFLAMSGGPEGARERRKPQSRRGRRGRDAPVRARDRRARHRGARAP